MATPLDEATRLAARTIRLNKAEHPAPGAECPVPELNPAREEVRAKLYALADKFVEELFK